MNRENIDRVIASILDEERPFNADDQSLCIRGHCYKVDGEEAPDVFESEHMAAFLGIGKRDAVEAGHAGLELVVELIPHRQIRWVDRVDRFDARREPAAGTTDITNAQGQVLAELPIHRDVPLVGVWALVGVYRPIVDALAVTVI